MVDLMFDSLETKWLDLEINNVRHPPFGLESSMMIPNEKLIVICMDVKDTFNIYEVHLVLHPSAIIRSVMMREIVCLCVLGGNAMIVYVDCIRRNKSLKSFKQIGVRLMISIISKEIPLKNKVTPFFICTPFSLWV